MYGPIFWTKFVDHLPHLKFAWAFAPLPTGWMVLRLGGSVPQPERVALSMRPDRRLYLTACIQALLGYAPDLRWLATVGRTGSSARFFGV